MADGFDIDKFIGVPLDDELKDEITLLITYFIRISDNNRRQDVVETARKSLLDGVRQASSFEGAQVFGAFMDKTAL